MTLEKPNKHEIMKHAFYMPTTTSKKSFTQTRPSKRSSQKSIFTPMTKTDSLKVSNNENNSKLIGSERLTNKSSNKSKNRKVLSPDLFRESNSSTPIN